LSKEKYQISFLKQHFPYNSNIMTGYEVNQIKTADFSGILPIGEKLGT
jgi:hypothetical protein